MWINDLASVLGIPAAAATLAGAMYAACDAAEKSARPGALNEIGRILKDMSWESSAPSAIVERAFALTFGERQLSRKCFVRSLAATVIFVIAIAISFGSRVGFSLQYYKTARDNPWVVIGYFLIAGCLPYYFAVWKSRILIRLSVRYNRNLGRTVALVAIDLLGSVIVSIVFVYVFIFIQLLLTYLHSPLDVAVPHVVYIFTTVTPILPILYFSTLMTSLWMTLTLLATIVLKLLAPLQHITVWFFDTDKHPLEAIGMVSGALLMLGSLAWSLVRALI